MTVLRFEVLVLSVYAAVFAVSTKRWRDAEIWVKVLQGQSLCVCLIVDVTLMLVRGPNVSHLCSLACTSTKLCHVSRGETVKHDSFNQNLDVCLHAAVFLLAECNQTSLSAQSQ